MVATLNVHEATVHTVEITIHTLRVGKKQVTMGLFRQLQRAPLVDPRTLTLHGVPWGHVHYWWDGDGSDRGPHDGTRRHLVWQEGDELRRDVVWERPPADWLRPYRQREQHAVNRLFLARFWSARETSDMPQRLFPDILTTIVVEGQPLAVRFNEKDADTIHGLWSARRNVRLFGEASLRAPQEAYLELCRRYRVTPQEDGPQGETAAREELAGYRMGQEAYRLRWCDQWQALASLPQLFIAV